MIAPEDGGEERSRCTLRGLSSQKREVGLEKPVLKQFTEVLVKVAIVVTIGPEKQWVGVGREEMRRLPVENHQHFNLLL